MIHRKKLSNILFEAKSVTFFSFPNRGSPVDPTIGAWSCVDEPWSEAVHLLHAGRVLEDEVPARLWFFRLEESQDGHQLDYTTQLGGDYDKLYYKDSY